MSNSMFMAVDGVLILVFIITTILLWQERARDERERMHRMLADRVGFLVGAGILVVVIIMQSIKHHTEPLLSIVLFLMLAAKIAGHLWSKHRR